MVQIPLSGYGGTSNIILEDQRKQADGYVAVLSDIAVDHVSKVCLCVRNTGSRAAFIKAVAFSNVHTRSLLESSVISLAPSQFVLKERKQEVREQMGFVLLFPDAGPMFNPERKHQKVKSRSNRLMESRRWSKLHVELVWCVCQVITVLMKSTQREQTLCGSERPLLATIILFCGDEISRQQFRR